MARDTAMPDQTLSIPPPDPQPLLRVFDHAYLSLD
jgi:hypothetical protein